MQSPVENFDWDAFEKGEVAGEKSREALEAAYSQTLNTVKEKEVQFKTAPLFCLYEFQYLSSFARFHMLRKEAFVMSTIFSQLIFSTWSLG